jgi:hypothetical protein
MKKNYFLPIALVMFACGTTSKSESNQSETDTTQTVEVVEEIIDTLPPFKSIASNFDTKTIILPEGFTYKVLFSEGDPVIRADGKKFPAKGNHDLCVFIPNDKDPNKARLYVSHETKRANPDLGDGGGATIFDIEKIDGQWKVVSDFMYVDFSGVGYTNRNCGGTLTQMVLFLLVKKLGPTTPIIYIWMARNDGYIMGKWSSNVAKYRIHC